MPQRHPSQDFLSSGAALKTNENHAFMTKGDFVSGFEFLSRKWVYFVPMQAWQKKAAHPVVAAIGGIFPFSAKMLPGNCRDALNFVSPTSLHLPLEMQAGLPDWPIKNNKHCQDICMEIILLINIFCIAPWITCYWWLRTSAPVTICQ